MTLSGPVRFLRGVVLFPARGLAVVALLLLPVACGGDDGAAGTSGDAEEADVAAQSSVEVEMDDDYFEPSTLNGEPGQPLTIHLTNEGSKEHNFSIETQQVDVDVPAGEEASVEVTFPKSGTLEFVCAYHAEAGMAGSLHVSGAGSSSQPSTGGGGY